MNVPEQIDTYINSHPEPKCSDLQALHNLIQQVNPDNRLWYIEGEVSDGKLVFNTNIGYGAYTIKYADGKTKEFYQVGFSANTTGISVYILGLADKTYLAKTYGEKLGKAKVTGYCIKFKALKDINLDVLETAIRDRFENEH